MLEMQEKILALGKEIQTLTKEGKACKNPFRMECIAQEVVRLRGKLAELEERYEIEYC